MTAKFFFNPLKILYILIFRTIKLWQFCNSRDIRITYSVPNKDPRLEILMESKNCNTVDKGKDYACKICDENERPKLYCNMFMGF